MAREQEALRAYLGVVVERLRACEDDLSLAGDAAALLEDRAVLKAIQLAEFQIGRARRVLHKVR